MQDGKKPEIHTVPNSDGGWDNEQDGEVISHHARKEEAVDTGKERAKQDETEHRIHNRDGEISEANSYGHDPFPPRG